MAGPATKLGSLTGHGGTVIGPGCPTVLINSVPAIRVGPDMHLCPMVTPGVPPIPHVGMVNIGPGVPTVLIGGLPASTVGDNFLCVGPPAPVVMGSLNVLIGTGGGGGGGGSGGGGGATSTTQCLEAGTVKPVKGTETFPISVQAAILECKPYLTPQALEQQIQAIADAYIAAGAPSPEEDKLTIADIVEILEGVERDEGFEASRFFASYLDFGTLTELTKSFVSGEDTNPDNDPNLMPTRFMLLYGADDSKLRHIDDHPDCGDGEKHKNNVENLRKSLKMLGYKVALTGPYDDEVYCAHVQYMANAIQEYFSNIGQLSEDAVTSPSDTSEEEIPKGFLVFRFSNRRKQSFAKTECTIKSSSGTTMLATTDSSGYCKLVDVPLDKYTVEVKAQTGTVSADIPWSSTDKNAHSIIIKK